MRKTVSTLTVKYVPVNLQSKRKRSRSVQTARVSALLQKQGALPLDTQVDFSDITRMPCYHAHIPKEKKGVFFREQRWLLRLAGWLARRGRETSLGFVVGWAKSSCVG